MRIRTIKPEFWKDKKVASWDHFTRLFFIGLWSASDDHGRGSAEPEILAADLFPYELSRDSRECLARVSRALSTLSEGGRIVIYRVGDDLFYEIPRWSDHQKVDKPGKSRLPTSSEGSVLDSRESRESLAPVSGNRDQGTGIREQGSSHPTPDDSYTPPAEPARGREVPESEAVWSIWPKKIKHLQALLAIGSAIRRDGFEKVMAGTKAIVSEDAKKQAVPPGRFLPDPIEFFDGSRYLDDPAQYGPREAIETPAQRAERVKFLDSEYAKHPGNRNSKAYDRDKTTDAQRAEAKAMLEEIQRLKQGGSK